MSLYDRAQQAARDVVDAAEQQLADAEADLEATRRELAEATTALAAAQRDAAASDAKADELRATIAERDATIVELRARIAELEAGQPPAEQPFVLGVTMPMSTTVGDAVTNVGALDGVQRKRYTGATDIVGSTNADEPLVLEHLAIDRLVRVVSGYVRFYDCVFSGSGASLTGDTGLLDCRPRDVKRVWVERCDFDPGEAGASSWLSGAIGHHMTITRSRFRRVVDFLQSYNNNSGGTETANVFEGNLGEWHAYFFADTKGVVHPSDVRTHNDGIQHQGGAGIDIVGNRLRGFVFLPDGVTTPPDLAGLPYAHLAHQAVMVQQNVQTSTPINPIVLDNWIEGYQHPIVIRTREASKGGGAAYNAVVEGNELLDDDHRYYATSGTDLYGTPGGKAYELRVDAAVTVNGVEYPKDGAPRALDAGNVFAATDRVKAATRRGKAFTVRRDSFTGGGA